MIRILPIWGVAVFAILFLAVPGHARPGGATGPAPIAPAPAPVPVIAAPVSYQLFADRIEALATTKASETVIITAQTSEKITNLAFESGQRVRNGDLLVRLDNSEEEAALRAAQARLAEAQSSHLRAESLQSASALSKATLQERLALLRQTEAEIDSIRARMEKLDIRAPFDGVLGLRDVSLGALVQPGDKITTIDDLSRIKVDFDLPSVYLADLAPGQKISGKVEAFGTRAFQGEVETIDTQVDPVTRTVRVRAVLPNEDGTLKPGLLMQVVLLKKERLSLLIPEEALIRRGGKTFVYLVADENGRTTARQTEVSLGGRQPGVVEVLSGLRSGDRVVTHGVVRISNGAEISVRATDKEDSTLEDLLKQKQEQSASPPTPGQDN